MTTNKQFPKPYGLTGKEIKAFIKSIQKANDEQLRSLGSRLFAEQRKRFKQSL
jgi:hypothetical protein